MRGYFPLVLPALLALAGVLASPASAQSPAAPACSLETLQHVRADAASEPDPQQGAERFRSGYEGCIATDPDTCLDALEFDVPGFPEAEPRLAALAPPLRSALLETLAACAEAAPWSSPGAIVYRIGQAYLRFHPGPITTAPCPGRADVPSLALPDGRCLVVVLPRPGASRLCPRLALATEAGARLRTLSLPAESWLRDPYLCCAEPALGLTPDGLVRVAPADNPAEGCEGRRSTVAEDIYRLRADTLEPVSLVAIGVR